MTKKQVTKHLKGRKLYVRFKDGTGKLVEMPLTDFAKMMDVPPKSIQKKETLDIDLALVSAYFRKKRR